MELNNSFIVNRPIDEAWEILTDLERVARCMPGAQLTEIDGDEHRGLVKVRVGPIVANYEGTAAFTSLDPENFIAVINARGRDPRQGNANAEIVATLTANGRNTTWVKLSTDLSLSGKLAGFGKGVIEDVSGNVLGQFAANLETALSGGDEAPEEVSPPQEGPRTIDAPDSEPVDLGAVAGMPMLKRAVPAFAIALLLIVLWLALRRRRR